MDWIIKKWSHKCYAWQKSRKAITEDNFKRPRDMGLLDRRVTIYEVAHVLQIGHDSAYEMMHSKTWVS